MNIPSIPTINEVIDSEGKKLFVQISYEDWSDFVKKWEHYTAEERFKAGLVSAFKEVAEIKQGKKKGKTLKEFISIL